MKQLIYNSLLFICLCYTLTSIAQEQRPDPRKNVIRVDIVYPYIGEYIVAYERMVAKSGSIVFRGAYIQTQRGLEINAWSFGITIRGYLNKWRHIPSGFYMGASTDFNHYLRLKGQDASTGSLQSYGLGLTFGKQWLLFENRVSLNPHIGASFYFSRAKVQDIANEEGISFNELFLLKDGLQFPFGLEMGIAFKRKKERKKEEKRKGKERQNDKAK